MKSEQEKPNYRRLIFSPLEASTATEDYIKEIQTRDGDGMPLYIKDMEYSPKDRKGFLPVKRGELITVLGRPGNGKTGFLLRWARARAQDLKEREARGEKTGVVLYFTMEQLVEELRLFHVAGVETISATDMANGRLSEADWGRVVNSLRGLHTTPLWFAGKSFRRRKDKIKINEGALYEALQSVETWQEDVVKQEIDSVFIDYLQRFRSDGRQDWVQFYGDLVNGLKDMAGDFATRFIVGVQARREVDKYKVEIPQMEDGQWTSGIEQQSDGMISVVRPRHYKQEGESFLDIPVKGYTQMVVSILKRKLGPEQFRQWVYFHPEYNRLDNAELKHFNPNEEMQNV